MTRIGVFGCKSTTVFLLEALARVTDIACVVTISPEAGAKNQVADYTNVAEYCANRGLECLVVNRYDLKRPQDALAVYDMALDVAFVVGWQRLIPATVLDTLSIGVFGMHGSTDDLPLGRGRSPMNWALIEQRKRFFINLFRYDAGVDSGVNLDTLASRIQPGDTGETMHYKNVLAIKTMILRNLDGLKSGSLELRGHKDAIPTFYPKRGPRDGLVDGGQVISRLTR